MERILHYLEQEVVQQIMVSVPTPCGLPIMTSVICMELQNFTPFQYQDPSGGLMMLPSDIVLIQDKSFKK